VVPSLLDELVVFTEFLMATVIDSVSIKGLRKIHFYQLLSYAAARESEGWHTGNKAHFNKRHGELVDWIDSILEQVEGERIVIPK